MLPDILFTVTANLGKVRSNGNIFQIIQAAEDAGLGKFTDSGKKGETNITITIFHL
jgi:hypothetical protein